MLLNRNHPTVGDLICIAERDRRRAHLLLDVLLATDPELARGTGPPAGRMGFVGPRGVEPQRPQTLSSRADTGDDGTLEEDLSGGASAPEQRGAEASKGPASVDDGPAEEFETLCLHGSQGKGVSSPPTRRPLYRADPDRVLRVLSANQFEDAFLAFREVYANALDAVRGRSDPKIQVRVAADRVVFEDNGAGLDESGLEALTTLGASTRRDDEAIGRFGIGFAAIFDPSLGVSRVDFVATRPGHEPVRVRFTPDVSGGVSISMTTAPAPKLGGSRVEICFDSVRAPADRVARAIEVLDTHAAYSGVHTEVNGRLLGKDFSDYIRAELKNGDWSHVERSLVVATAVRGAVGVAAIDPSRSQSVFRAYQRGLFVSEIPLARVHGRPWPRGVFGAVHAEGLDLVASRKRLCRKRKLRALPRGATKACPRGRVSRGSQF